MNIFVFSPKLLVFISMVILFSCRHSNDKKLESALELAGDNRAELEKVISHYSQNPADSLKLEAAQFLIENMRRHYSQQVKPSEKFWELLQYEEPIVLRRIRNMEDEQILADFDAYKYGLKKELVWDAINDTEIGKEYRPDLHTLDAAFLIDNIDMAFQVKEHEWCNDLSFEEFCEYVLPYRFNNEPVYMKRERIYNHFKPFFYADSLENDPVKTISWFNPFLKNFWWDWFDDTPMPNLGFYNIFYCNFPHSVCSQQLVVEGAILRSGGMPLTEIFTPYIREANRGHSWCGLVRHDEVPDLFHAIYNAPGEISLTHTPFTATKLYQKTFSVQPESPVFLKAENENLPGGSYSSPCIKDVTGDYVPVRNVELELTATPAENNLCWFSIFTRGGWSPVGWGEISKNRKKVLFKNVPIGLTGLACTFNSRKMTPRSRLVTVTKNGLEDIRAGEQKINLTITRKFPSKVRLQKIRRQTIGTKVQGANKPDFTDSVTLYVINDTLQPCMQDFEFNNKNHYRFYRVYAPKRALQIAEVEFLTETKIPGTEEATPLPVWSKNDPGQKIFYKYEGKEVAEEPDSTVFDGNLLTFSTQKWTGLDLGAPHLVNRIRIAPRNALNGIVRGDNYQLFYWHSGWQPAGVVKAEHNFLEFHHVPANTLYWLRNLDHGVEEQPFFYANGKQVFSNQPIQ